MAAHRLPGRPGDHHRHATRSRLGQRLGLLAAVLVSLAEGQLRRAGHHNRADAGQAPRRQHRRACVSRAYLSRAYLSRAYLSRAYLSRGYLSRAHADNRRLKTGQAVQRTSPSRVG